MGQVTFAIGDIHGRLDLLELAVSEIDTYKGDKRVILLGDYVDRGPDSAGVIEFLRKLDNSYVCLMGNHEELMLDSLVGGYGTALWYMNGGQQTLNSYPDGIVPQEHIEWLQERPYFINDGVRFFVHAGIDPRKPLAEQDLFTLTWVREVFLRATKLPMHIVHGHTHTHAEKQTAIPENLPHRTNLDTCAYHTGLLSIGIFEDHQVQPTSIFQVSL
jgi:serine/threonine protein phosphatase 1